MLFRDLSTSQPKWRTTFGRPQPQLGAFTTIKSDSNSSYHSLQVQANKRFSHGIEFTTSYTWSHAIDEVSDLFDLAGTLALPRIALIGDESVVMQISNVAPPLGV